MGEERELSQRYVMYNQEAHFWQTWRELQHCQIRTDAEWSWPFWKPSLLDWYGDTTRILRPLRARFKTGRKSDRTEEMGTRKHLVKEMWRRAEEGVWRSQVHIICGLCHNWAPDVDDRQRLYLLPERKHLGCLQGRGLSFEEAFRRALSAGAAIGCKLVYVVSEA